MHHKSSTLDFAAETRRLCAREDHDDRSLSLSGVAVERRVLARDRHTTLADMYATEVVVKVMWCGVEW